MFELVKALTSMVAGIGATNIAMNVIHKATPQAVSKAGKIINTVGAIALSTVVADAASEKVEEYFDNGKALVDKFKSIAKDKTEANTVVIHETTFKDADGNIVAAVRDSDFTNEELAKMANIPEATVRPITKEETNNGNTAAE